MVFFQTNRSLKNDMVICTSKLKSFSMKTDSSKHVALIRYFTILSLTLGLF
jgi:hypothetical protein